VSKRLRVYELRITYPPGSLEPGWQPPGWEPETFDRAGRERKDPAKFRWPPQRRFLSKAGAERRASLLSGWGAMVVVRQSLPVRWPEMGEQLTLLEEAS
jgi:hypothetical protein